MKEWNKYLGLCGLILLLISLTAIGFKLYFWVGMIILAIEMIIINDNEKLFLAIAAIRNDTDANQWFISRQGLFAFNKQNENMSEVSLNWRKATVEELIEYFKEN